MKACETLWLHTYKAVLIICRGIPSPVHNNMNDFISKKFIHKTKAVCYVQVREMWKFVGKIPKFL